MSTDSVVMVMLSGILIANYQASTMINNVGMLIGLVFAFLGGAFIAKYVVKTSTVVWSYANIILCALTFVLCLVLGSNGMSKIGVMGIPMILSFGIPVLGWICNIIAMKFYELDRERMVEIQKDIAEKKKAARAQAK
jgi:peptidoglycan/LPS O-acetylase OafA/YrhL